MSGRSTIQLKIMSVLIAYTIVTATMSILSMLFISILASLISVGRKERSVRLSMWRVATIPEFSGSNLRWSRAAH